jgi:hypothetical protein
MTFSKVMNNNTPKIHMRQQKLLKNQSNLQKRRKLDSAIYSLLVGEGRGRNVPVLVYVCFNT